MSSMYLNEAKLRRANGVYNIYSINKIMSSGFNRVVMVETDNVELWDPSETVNALIRIFNKNKEEGKELGEDLFDLYKENIEYIKYINPWDQALREGQKLNRIKVLYEMASHLAKFRSN